MTITQLEYIVAVYQEKNFSKAAEKCFVTQPTLSMQINKLEEELGVKIFDRDKKPVKATPIGKKIIHQAKTNIRGMNQIHDIINQSKNEISGELHLGIIPTLAPYLLPLFITKFLRKYPAVNLKIEELVSEQIISGLKQDFLDAGILVTPVDDISIAETPLFYETFVAYISGNHPLIHNDFIELKNLKADEMLLLSEGHCFRNQVVNICPDREGLNNKNQLRFETGSLETLKRIVETNFGYTLLPELATMNIPDINRKYIKELGEPKPVREVSIITYRHVLKRKLIEALKHTILENIPDALKDKNRGTIIEW
jgi:LysR family transcriptional regulator, hydrogen peroxide-inducible genes activator